jgi:anti-sigma-K factor RskA
MMAALAASLLLAAALGAWSLRAVAERDRVRAASIAVAARARNESVTLRAEIAERDRTLQALTGRDVRVVELTTAGARAPWARMFWDRGANHWMMFAGNLPKPAPGRTYELWLISDGRKIPAGTFTPNERGEAVMQARYALAPDKLQALAVTAEPEGGVDVPTGPVVISGAAASSR